MKKSTKDDLFFIGFVVVIGIIFAIALRVKANEDYVYAVSSTEYTDEGRNYEYYTKANCEIVAIADDESVVYYKHNGNVYSFYTDGCTDCEVGDKWLFTFNEKGDVVSIE